MNRLGITLLILLLMQCGIAGRLLWSERNSTQLEVSQKLASVGSYIVDELHISDQQGSEAVLSRQGDHWLLPQLDNLPADAAKVQQALSTLTLEDAGWPVGSTLAARQRFRVADYHFGRQLTLKAHGQILQTVYLGTSPGFRKIHARNEQQDGIFSIELNLFDVPAEAAKWLDKRLLQTRAPMSIIADGYSLHRESGSWRMGNGESPDQRELDALLGALRSLQVTDIAAKSVTADALEAELILTVEGLASSNTLSLYSIDGAHYISSSEYQRLFQLSNYDYDRLIGIDAFLLSGAQ